MIKIYRGWFDQPSTQQDYHALHGRRCIVYDSGEGKSVQVYFTEGPVRSMEVLRYCISECQF